MKKIARRVAMLYINWLYQKRFFYQEKELDREPKLYGLLLALANDLLAFSGYIPRGKEDIPGE